MNAGLQPPMLAEVAPARAARVAVMAWGVLAALGVAGLVVIHFIPPEGNPLYPKCALFTMTGLHCPGCGSFRAVHHLTHGRWGAALSSNALLVLSLPLVAGWGAASWLRRRRGLAAWHPGRWLVAAAVAMFVFGVLRNLPWEPFAWLAP